MPYWRLYYHFIWSTKYRLSLIDPVFEQNLYNIIIAKVKALNCIPYAIGGTEDHIHLAASVPPDISLSDFIGQIKGNSAHFINYAYHPTDPFVWQREYGVLSFGGTTLDYVAQYIQNQRKHHAENTIEPFLERITGKSA